MTTPDIRPNAPEETHPPYPSYDSLLASQKWVRPAPNGGQLLYWLLNGPLTSAISVMSSPNNPDSRQPYYNQATNTWNSIAKLPVSEPKVSSIRVHVHELRDWEDTWCEMHWDHSDPEYEAEGVEWGILKQSNEDNGGPDLSEVALDDLQLLKCCGMARPRDKDASLVVKSAVDGEEGFVTVHDYLTAVHPLLMRLMEEIRAAMGTANGDDEPLAEDTELKVSLNGVQILRIKKRRNG